MIYKHGVVGDYLYIMGMLQRAYKLVEFEGNFYFIDKGNMVAKDARIYLSDTFVAGKTHNGYALEPGWYTFDAEGKMILG